MKTVYEFSFNHEKHGKVEVQVIEADNRTWNALALYYQGTTPLYAFTHYEDPGEQTEETIKRDIEKLIQRRDDREEGEN